VPNIKKTHVLRMLF